MAVNQKSTKSKTTTSKTTDTKTKKSPPKQPPKSDRASRVMQQHLKDQQANRQIAAIVLFTLAVFSFFVSIIEGANVWKFMHEFSFGLFGLGAFMWPVLFGYIAMLCERNKLSSGIGTKIFQSVTLLILLCSTIFIFNNQIGEGYFTDIKDIYIAKTKTNGGAIGALIGGLLLRLFGMLPAVIVILLLVFLFFMLTTSTTLHSMFVFLVRPFRTIRQQASTVMDQVHEDFANKKPVDNYDNPVSGLSFNSRQKPSKSNSAKNFSDFDIAMDDNEYIEDFNNNNNYYYYGDDIQNNFTHSSTQSGNSTFNDDIYDINNIQPQKYELPFEDNRTNNSVNNSQINLQSNNQSNNPTNDFSADFENSQAPTPLATDEIIEKAKTNAGTESVAPDTLKPGEKAKVRTYRFPPKSLLKSSAKEENLNIEEELKENAEMLVDTLKSFNVETTVIGISRGPAVTRYELKPASGVKINKITNLADDIALNLAASGVRIEAPIPNKSAVGIEIPNQNTSVVSMRELIESSAFITAKSYLTVTLGKNITGSVTVTDLAKMPHLLIAGSTGSGKSVCINSLIVSILYKASPDEVKLLMIDPKVVELGIYNGIPHLLVPVVTDPRKASGALSWAVTEMLSRYKIFADNNVRDLSGYNRLCETHSDKKPLPQIVIIIDELADLMMAAPKEVEDSICRLAQMARAAGMHLVIATQRPSVDVITGIIKANIPSRIAFAVSSQVDSRTILDSAGAEKLLGRGDMLFYPLGASKPTRIQGCFVTDEEIESIIEFVKKSSTDEQCEYDEAVAKEIELRAAPDKKESSSSAAASGESSDEMFSQAVECVVDTGEASTTLLQRKLRLGYARAARIMDELEAKGIVGSPDGSKKRKVLISKQQWLEMNVRTDEN